MRRGECRNAGDPRPGRFLPIPSLQTIASRMGGMGVPSYLFKRHFGGNKGHLFRHGLHVDGKGFEAVKKSELLGWSPSLGGAEEGPSVLGLMCERTGGGGRIGKALPVIAQAVSSRSNGEKEEFATGGGCGGRCSFEHIQPKGGERLRGSGSSSAQNLSECRTLNWKNILSYEVI